MNKELLRIGIILHPLNGYKQRFTRYPVVSMTDKRINLKSFTLSTAQLMKPDSTAQNARSLNFFIFCWPEDQSRALKLLLKTIDSEYRIFVTQAQQMKKFLDGPPQIIEETL